ncbi:MAG TPA: cbb3-type cytochrome oxidase assembly protein CcoS [Bacteroidia bacterium]|nr:cbb3-type cytochrome oxidase assembly protein CcoS [Bacteroidia bacterium]
MSVMFVLISASLVLALAFLAAFIWSVRSGQYEDDFTPSVRMLFEEKPSGPASETNSQPNNQTE